MNAPKHRAVEARMENGSVWLVPVAAIADHCARDVAAQDNVDVDVARRYFVEPKFRDDMLVIQWAQGSVSWAEIADRAHCITPGEVTPDFDINVAWTVAQKTVVEV